MVARRCVLVAALVGVASLAGCLNGSEFVTDGDRSLPSSGVVRSAVAVVGEGGVNAYHEDFALTPELVPAFRAFVGDIGALTLTLSAEQDVARAKEEDLARVQLETGELYWIEGTRLFVVNLVESTSPLFEDAADPLSLDYHGTGVMSRIARTAPATAIVHVHTHLPVWMERPVPGPGAEYFAESAIRGIRWAGEQPWVDALSLSFGPHLNAPDAGPVTDTMTRLTASTRAASDAGKLVIAASGNTGNPPWLSPVAGPPWVIAVGMAETEERGDMWDTSRPPDVVANTSVTVATRDSRNGTMGFGGTSAAAPGLAARVANVLTALRAEAGLDALTGRTVPGSLIPADALAPGSAAIGPWEVRAALNVTATYWGVEDWSPQPNANLVFTVGNATVPVNPVVPAAQFGWGYIDADEERAALDLLREYALSRDGSLLQNPADKGPSRDFMEASFAAREAYWGAKTGGP